MVIATVIPLLFLVSGYSFLNCWNVALWYTARQIGHRLYLRIALYGLFMFIAAVLIYELSWPYELHQFYLEYQLHQLKKPQAPFDFAPYAMLVIKIECLAIVIGLFGGHLLSLLSLPWRNTLLRLTLKDDDLELLVIKAMEKSLPISVTCANGKVYVGYITHGFEPHIARNDIKIMPLLSGYRDINNLKVYFTTNYRETYNSLDIQSESQKHCSSHYLCIEDFEIILPIKQVQSVNLFDIETFINFKHSFKRHEA